MFHNQVVVRELDCCYLWKLAVEGSKPFELKAEKQKVSGWRRVPQLLFKSWSDITYLIVIDKHTIKCEN